jgi:hypothetical protein
VEAPTLTHYPFAAVARLIRTDSARRYFNWRAMRNFPTAYAELRIVRDKWTKLAA